MGNDQTDLSSKVGSGQTVVNKGDTLGDGSGQTDVVLNENDHRENTF